MLRRTVIVLAWPVTIAAFCYGVEDWRCNRAWEKYRAASEAKGEYLDWKHFIPPPVPDDQNFAKAGTLAQTLFNPDEDKIAWKRDIFFKAGKAQLPKSASIGFHFTDLAAWEKAMTAATQPGAPEYGVSIDVSPDPDSASRTAAAPGVLRLMQDIGPLIEELRAASARPFTQYPFHYNTDNPASIALPYYSTLQVFGGRLRLRACAELALGRDEEAAADLKLMSYLSDSMRNDKFLIAILVRITILAQQSQVIWEGLSEHRWNDSELAAIQQGMLAENYVAEMRRDLDAERAAMVSVIEYIRTKKDFEVMAKILEPEEAEDGSSERDRKMTTYLLWLMPSGWFQSEKLNYAQAFEARFRNVFDPVAKRVFPDMMASNMKVGRAAPNSDFQAVLQQHFVEWKALSVFDKGIVSKAASAQCVCDEAAIACALERYRLAKGSYPAQLDVVAPAFIRELPHEVTNGGPYHYRFIDSDNYSLYSIGWDLTDHEGKPGTKQYGLDGDWVWR